MSLKLFKQYLIEEDGRSNYVQNGVVTSRGIPTPLPQSPDGWQEMKFAWERNKQRHGIQRNFGDLGFVLDGAKIVRDGLYRTNVDRKMYLLVQRLKLQYTTFYKWYYETIYKGELDFSTVKDDQSGLRVDVNIMEGGLYKLINANWSTQYRIEFDADAVNVKQDGIALQESGKFAVADGVEILKSVYDTNFFLPIALINREGNLPYMAYLSHTLESVASLSWADKLASENYLMKAADNNANTIDVRFVGKLKFTCKDNDPANGFRVRILRSNQDIANQNDYQLFSLTPTLDSYEYDVDMTVPLQPGERLYIEGIYFGGGGTEVNIEFNPGSELTASYEERGKTTYCKAFLRKHLFRKLMKKIAGSEEYAISTLLDSDDRIITSFDAIRNIEGAGIQTSLSDLFADINADLCAGMGIINGAATANLPAGHRVTIEAREGYFDDTDPVDLGEAKEFNVVPASDMLVSKIKVGWKEPQTEDVNGKYGFNASQQYTTPIKRTDNEYTTVSPYKADPFEIEIHRIMFDGKDTTDNKRDADLAVMWVERSQADVTATVSFFATGNKIRVSDSLEFVVGQKIRFSGSTSNNLEAFVTAVTVVPSLSLQIVDLSATLTNEGPVSVLIEWIEGITYNLVRETYTNEGDPDDFGVPSPTTVFNIDLSPKRMLLRHGRWLASLLSGYETEKIQFQSGTRNTNLKTIQAGVTTRENSDVAISTLGDKIFLPFLFNVKANGDNDLATLMEANPNRCFKFTWEGVEYRGYNMKAAFAPNELNEQEYSLLATADNDLTELIV